MKCNPANPKEAQPLNVWEEIFPVRFAAIDKSDSLTLNAIFQFFQEGAISHAENLCVGRKDLAQTGQVWILSRMSVVVEKRPKYCQTIKIRTWPSGGEKLFAFRDYHICGEDDIPLISARSSWLIIDIAKRRPLRPQSMMEIMPSNEGNYAMTSNPASLAENGNLQKAAERKALYTDIDYNGHVNNVRYIQWIEDTLDPLLLEKAVKMRFDINYMNEILYGEDTEIFSAPMEAEAGITAFAFEGRKKASGQVAFRSELRLWQ